MILVDSNIPMYGPALSATSERDPTLAHLPWIPGLLFLQSGGVQILPEHHQAKFI